MSTECRSIKTTEATQLYLYYFLYPIENARLVQISLLPNLHFLMADVFAKRFGLRLCAAHWPSNSVYFSLSLYSSMQALNIESVCYLNPGSAGFGIAAFFKYRLPIFHSGIFLVFRPFTFIRCGVFP